MIAVENKSSWNVKESLEKPRIKKIYKISRKQLLKEWKVGLIKFINKYFRILRYFLTSLKEVNTNILDFRYMYLLLYSNITGFRNSIKTKGSCDFYCKLHISVKTC
jgi:hypothetical protein